MNNEGRERLKNLTRKLADNSFIKASDELATNAEFEAALDELSHHLKEIRRRSVELHEEKMQA